MITWSSFVASLYITLCYSRLLNFWWIILISCPITGKALLRFQFQNIGRLTRRLDFRRALRILSFTLIRKILVISVQRPSVLTFIFDIGYHNSLMFLIWWQIEILLITLNLRQILLLLYLLYDLRSDRFLFLDMIPEWLLISIKQSVVLYERWLFLSIRGNWVTGMQTMSSFLNALQWDCLLGLGNFLSLTNASQFQWAWMLFIKEVVICCCLKLRVSLRQAILVVCF